MNKTLSFGKDNNIKMPVSVLIGLIVLVAGFVVGWTTTSIQVAANTEDIKGVKSNQTEMEKTVIKHGVYYENIMKSLDEIKAQQ